MQQYSKYRIITVGFILMFIFAIAAIYTNTKDIVAKKTDMNKVREQQQIENNFDNTNVVNQTSQNEIDYKLSDLTGRIESLESKVYSKADSNENIGVRCHVQGISNDGVFVPMSDQDAIREARENSKEVVITCTFD